MFTQKALQISFNTLIMGHEQCKRRQSKKKKEKEKKEARRRRYCPKRKPNEHLHNCMQIN